MVLLAIISVSLHSSVGLSAQDYGAVNPVTAMTFARTLLAAATDGCELSAVDSRFMNSPLEVKVDSDLNSVVFQNVLVDVTFSRVDASVRYFSVRVENRGPRLLTGDECKERAVRFMQIALPEPGWEPKNVSTPNDSSAQVNFQFSRNGIPYHWGYDAFCKVDRSSGCISTMGRSWRIPQPTFGPTAAGVSEQAARYSLFEAFTRYSDLPNPLLLSIRLCWALPAFPEPREMTALATQAFEGRKAILVYCAAIADPATFQPRSGIYWRAWYGFCDASNGQTLHFVPMGFFTTGAETFSLKEGVTLTGVPENPSPITLLNGASRIRVKDALLTPIESPQALQGKLITLITDSRALSGKFNDESGLFGMQIGDKVYWYAPNKELRNALEKSEPSDKTPFDSKTKTSR